MNLKKLGANLTEIDTGKMQILVSYQTPVAMHYSGDDMVYITDKFWSRTTSHHINSWINDNLTDTITQSALDNLLSEVK